jgi:dipeptidyl aminopeptidase/acylaminoacyl peptidase
MAVKGQWGPPAMDDVMQGVDLLIDQGLVDTGRMYVTGGSYGGYLTVWIAAHSDRFKAAASVRGVYNLLSFFGTADIPSFVRDEIGYTPLENPQYLWEQSPLAHAYRVKIPMLIIHSENDFRVPVSEGEQLFGYLRRLGVETEFVRYPREGHELTRSGEPEHRIDHMTRIVEWFDKYGGRA